MTKLLKPSPHYSYSNLDKNHNNSSLVCLDDDKKSSKSKHRCPGWRKKGKYHKTSSPSRNEAFKGTKDETSPIIESFNDETDSSYLDFCSVHSKEVADEHRSFLIYYFGLDNGQVEKIARPLDSFADPTKQTLNIKYSTSKAFGKNSKVTSAKKKSHINEFSSSTSGWVDFSDSVSEDTFTTCSVTESSLEFPDFYPLVSPDTSTDHSLGKSCEKELFPEDSIAFSGENVPTDFDDFVSESYFPKTDDKTDFIGNDTFDSIFRLKKPKVDETVKSSSASCSNDSADISMVPIKEDKNDHKCNVEERLMLFVLMAGQTIQVNCDNSENSGQPQNRCKTFNSDNKINSLSSKCSGEGDEIGDSEDTIKANGCPQDCLLERSQCTSLEAEHVTGRNSISLKLDNKETIEFTQAASSCSENKDSNGYEKRMKIRLENIECSLNDLTKDEFPTNGDERNGLTHHKTNTERDEPTSIFVETKQNIAPSHKNGIPPLYPRTNRNKKSIDSSSSTFESYSLDEFEEDDCIIEEVYLNGTFEELDEDTTTSNDSSTSISSFQRNYESMAEDDDSDSFYSSDEDEEYMFSYGYYSLTEDDINNSFDYEDEICHRPSDLNEFVQFSLDETRVTSDTPNEDGESSLSNEDTSLTESREDTSECSSLYFHSDVKPKSSNILPSAQIPKVNSSSSFVYSVDESVSLCGLSLVDDLSVNQSTVANKQLHLGICSNNQPNAGSIDMTFTCDTNEQSPQAEISIFAEQDTSSSEKNGENDVGDSCYITPSLKYHDDTSDDSIDLVTRRKYLTQFLESSIKGELFSGAMEGDSELKEEVTELISKFRRESERQRERTRNVREGLTDRKLAGV